MQSNLKVAKAVCFQQKRAAFLLYQLVIIWRISSCEFNIDTACVELLFADGSMISIDCIAVENEIADNRFDRAELDWLLYNKPLEYADLVLNGGIEEYCKTSREHSTIED